MPRPAEKYVLEATGKPELSNTMIRKYENLKRVALHVACYDLPDSEKCQSCQLILKHLEILKVQFYAEMAILPQLRRVAKRAQDALVYLQTWITMNSKVDGGILVRRYYENPKEAGLNAAPTQEEPNANADFTEENMEGLNEG